MKYYVSKNKLYNLFTKSELVKTKIVKESRKRKRTVPNFTNNNNNNNRTILSPLSKKIYDSIDDTDKEYFLIDLIKDNKYLDLINDDIDDDDYLEKMENNMLGFYMENFVCHHIKCPSCHQYTLMKYSIKNMPVIDVICSNKDYHDNNEDVKYFQIKVSVNNNNRYFNNKYIVVGSKKYGYNCHEIYGSEKMNEKRTLIGYICLYLDSFSDNKYKINRNSSFVLNPIVNTSKHEKYYEYIDNTKIFFNRPIIKWNENIVKKLDLKKICNTWIVNTNTVYYDIELINNPYENENLNNQYAGYYYKYIKYKYKYLNQKNYEKIDNIKACKNI